MSTVMITINILVIVVAIITVLHERVIRKILRDLEEFNAFFEALENHDRMPMIGPPHPKEEKTKHHFDDTYPPFMMTEHMPSDKIEKNVYTHETETIGGEGNEDPKTK